MSNNQPNLHPDTAEFYDLLDKVKNSDSEAGRSMRIFGTPIPTKNDSDSADQFFGKLRQYYYGFDPYSSERMNVLEEFERKVLGSQSGGIFRKGDLEALNRYLKEKTNGA